MKCYVPGIQNIIIKDTITETGQTEYCEEGKEVVKESSGIISHLKGVVTQNANEHMFKFYLNRTIW